MKFHADSIEYWSDHGIETVFFGNAEAELALLMSSIPETTDHYLEWNDQSNACINAIKKAELSGQTFRLQLFAKAANELGESTFEITFSCDANTFHAVKTRLEMILGDTLVIKKSKAVPKSPPKKNYSTIRYLNLEGKNLTKLPEYVSEMTTLQTAKLARNPKLDFAEVCEVLALLPVKYLNFTTEKGIPENIGALALLETLIIDGLKTPITLPESMLNLKNLEYLYIQSDADVYLPEHFATISQLKSLHLRAPNWDES